MRRKRRESGSATVEAALILPIAVLFVFGIVQFSTLTFNLNNAAYGSTEGVRYAAVHGSTSSQPCSATDVRSKVLASMPGVPASVVTVTTSWNPDNSPGSVVTVSVSIKSWLQLFLKNPPPVGAKTQMTILQ
jgi:Flp pilus assembly protein TadG